jgi:amino acid adenylation domain-containing protein/FkbM family methyltransferase
MQTGLVDKLMDPREVEALLREQAGVLDCVVLARGPETSGRKLVAYVVPNGPFVPERLHAAMPAGMAPSAYVPVSAVPLTPAGEVDESALALLEVIDTDLVKRWEERLREVPGVEEAAVVVHDQPEPQSALHLSDLRPYGLHSANDKRRLPGGNTLPPAVSVESTDGRPSISHGAPLPSGLGEPATLPEALRRAASAHSANGTLHLQHDGSEVFRSYANLMEEAERILSGLRQRQGLRPGDKVIFQLDRTQDFLAAFWGCVLGGFIPVPIAVAPTYDEASAAVAKLHNAWQMLDHPVVLTSRELAPALHRWAGRPGHDGFHLEEVDSLRAESPDPDWYPGQPDDLAILLLTSGSTGKPKGVKLSHRNLLAMAAGTAVSQNFTDRDVTLNWMPLDHVGAISFLSCMATYLGCTQIHALTKTVLEDPLRWIRWIERYRATISWAPNFAFGLLNDRAEQIERGQWDLSSMRFLVSAGESVVAGTARRFLQLFRPYGLADTSLVPAFGMSETCSGITWSNRFSLANSSDDDSFVEVGPPIPGASLRIVSDEGRVVNEGTIGHLQLTGISVTSGYFDNPEVNRESFTEDGWFRTGDLGFLRDGRLTLTGRGKDVIIINGINYFSHEIEAVVEEVDGIETSFTAACAISGPQSVDELAIFFHAPGIAENRLASLLAEIRGRVARKIGINPTCLIPVARDAIPKTEIGKIQRTLLRKRFEAGEFDAILKHVESVSGGAGTLPAWFFRTIWRRKQAVPRVGKRPAGLTLIFVDREGLGDEVRAELERRDTPCATVEPGPAFARLGVDRFRIHPGEPEDYKRLVRSVIAEIGPIEQVVHLWTCGAPEGRGIADPEDLERELERGIGSFLHLVKALAGVPDSDERIRLLAVSTRSQPALTSDEIVPARAAVAGLVKTIGLETPSLDCRHVDLPPEQPEGNSARLIRELESCADHEVAYRNGRRLVPRLEKVNMLAERQCDLPFRKGGLYLLTGGLGGIGMELARHLLEKYQARLLLVGRTVVPNSESAAIHDNKDDLESRRARSLRKLMGLGDVLYEVADIADPEQLRQAVKRARTHWGCELDGVIHLAAAYHDRLLADETSASLASILRPKVQGTRALHELVHDRPGCLFLTFSSAVTSFGGTMVGAYAAANRVLEAFAHAQRRCGLRSHCYSWTTWQEIGISQGHESKDVLRARGIQDIAVEQGLNSLFAGLSRGQPHLVIGLDGSNLFIRRHLDQDSPRVQRLIAYVTASSSTISPDCLRDMAVCDQFGTPSTCEFVKIREMPRNAEGTIDRDRLMDLARRGPVEHVEPRTHEERGLTEIWKQLLGVPRAGIHDNFFELGGHSLLAAQVLTRIRDEFGVDVPVRALFESPTVAGLARQIQSSRFAVPQLPLKPVPRDGELPLSFAQHRLWFIDQLESGAAGYNVATAFRLHGALNSSALERAIGEVIRRHEVLRTCFPSRNGLPVQVITSPGPWALSVHNVSALPDPEAQAQAMLRDEAARPFELARGPLFRATLLQLADQEHLLLLTMHHIVSDGWSMGVFNRELAALYTAFAKGQPSPLEEPTVQYVDYAAWQRGQLTDMALQSQLDYWKDQLDGVPRLLDLPSDRPRPAVQSYRGRQRTFSLTRELTEQLKALSQKEGCTLFMTLTAVLQVLLWRLSGQERFIVSTAIANRDRPETQGMIGCLINVLLLKAVLGDNPPFRELLGRVRETALGAYAHQDVPFERLVEELAAERDLSFNPLTQVMFVLLSQPIDHLELAGLQVRPVAVDSTGTPYDITVHMIETAAGLSGFIDYSTDLFDADTIARMVEQFRQLLAAVVQEPSERISRLPMLSETERRHLLTAWNGTEVDYPRDRCVHELFEQQASLTPYSTAVEFEGDSLTYAQLENKSNQLASCLRFLGVGPDVLVGLCVERSLEMLVGLLGVLKAGGAYVPLDPSYPAERIDFMLDDSQVRVLLTQERLLTALPETQKFERVAAGAWSRNDLIADVRPDPFPAETIARRRTVLCLDADWHLVERESETRPIGPVGADNLAYVIYTSGSTGKPKGVEISHRSVVNFLSSMRKKPGSTANDTLLAVTTLSFDIAGLELFLPLTTGARVVIASREVAADGARLAALLKKSNATVMQATPATWRLLLEAGWPGDPALKVLCGGEALPRTLANQLAPRCAELWNMYGPTETTIWSAVGRVSAGDGPVFLGQPIANTRIYVLDRELQPVPMGVPGELCIGGDGVARGYHNRAELTAERFVKDPYSARPGAKLYRTGDLVRIRSAGKTEFLGRLDDQVKVRGVRIELGEIESAMNRHPAIREAVAAARDDSSGERQLVAYYVADPGQAPTTDELRRHAKELLPEGMIPSAFVRMEALPRTLNGKIDRKALPAPEQTRPQLAEKMVAPRTPEEEALAGIWAKCLGIERVGIHDDFFDLGGHSLLATRLMHQVHERFQVELPVRALFEAPTVAGLTERLQSFRSSGAGQSVAPPRPVPRGGDLPLSYAQQRLWFIDQLTPGTVSYNLCSAFRLRGALNSAALDRSMAEIVRRHESLRTTFPSDQGRPIQFIDSGDGWRLPVEDMSHLTVAAQEAEVRRRVDESAERPFDLTHGPLFRTLLLRLNDEEHVLLLGMHHIISDGMSLDVFGRELAKLYEAYSKGHDFSLPALPIQYADYAVWQRRYLESGVLRVQMEYWVKELEGLPRLLELPADRPRPPVQSFRGAHRAFALSKELSDRLKDLGRREGTTLFMTLMAAFQTLLGRYGGQERFIVSTGIADRDRPETQGLIGCLINILLLKADLSGNPTFRDMLARVRKIAIDAFTHRDMPFESLVEQLAPERDLSYNPLTQVMFVLLNGPMNHLEISGLNIQPLEIEMTVSPYDLVMHMWETAEGLAGFWHYSTDLFESATIERMLGQFLQLLEAIVTDPGRRVLDLPLLREADRQRMLVEWNDTRWDFPSDKCLHELFELQARLKPDAVAIIFGKEQWTYGELDSQANRLARDLRRRGVVSDTLVGLCVERSAEMIVGMLGIMKAGGAYVPLDPNYPQERLSFMLQDTGAGLVLTQQRLLAGLGVLPAEVVCLDTQWPEIARESDEKPASGVGPLNLSYVIFTSGSTGMPKGIAIQHRGVLNNIVDLNRRHGVGPGDSVLCLSSLSFDMCVYEVFGMLEAGATIVMPAPEGLREPGHWAELMQRHRITIWNSAPALLKMLVDYVSGRPELWPRDLHLAILGGDWVPVSLPDRLKAMAPRVRFIVLGGATEASIHSIIFPVDKVDPEWKSIPYGKPQYNQKAYILNPRLQPAPMGVVGDLYLGGIGLGRGYFGRPEQTAERFLPNPFAAGPGERIYRTGDLARYGPDGTIELIGRADFQVKIRGMRIECGEIEAVLRRHPGVREAVVAAKDVGGDRRLIAYVRPSPDTASPICHRLRLDHAGLADGWQWTELPNGLPILCRNKMETEFSYQEIFEQKSYLRHGITLRDGACVFDVGANIGMFALQIAEQCRDATIYAFEPIPPVFALLQANMALHGKNTRLFNCGIARDSTEATFTYLPHLSLISSRFADSAADRETVKSFLRNERKIDGQLVDELLEDRLVSEQVTCPMKTLSQVIRENHIERIDLLKIDVEKGELDALAGIEPHDWPKIRQMVVEVYDIEGRVAAVTKLLQERGYTVETEQDEMLTDTHFRNVYAVREDSAPAPHTKNGSADHTDRTRWKKPDDLLTDLRSLLKDKLPDYMVPTAIVLMDELPLSPNGKIDRKALPLPEAPVSRVNPTSSQPRTPVEDILASICANVLNVAAVGIFDNFFELGGHSLLATQVISQVRQAFRVELPLRTLFESPTVAGLAVCIESARQTGTSRQTAPLAPIAGDRSRPLPLSFAQQRLWFMDQLLPGSPAYNIPFTFDLTGELRVDALRRSIGELWRRHEVLRTTFPQVEGQPAQTIGAMKDCRLELVDLGTLPHAEREAEAGRQVDAESRRPFDLGSGPLFRATLLRLDSRHHVLCFILHHIAADGWSLGVFARELSILYDAFSADRPSPLPGLPIQYADYAVWQRDELQGEALESLIAFWRKQLLGAPEKLELPIDHARPPVQTLRGARHVFELPASLREAVVGVSRQEGATLFMTLLTVFKIFLRARTKQEDLVVGSPFANRTRSETMGLMGPFVNTVVLRTHLNGNPTFRELVARIREVVLETDAHQDLPFEKVVEIVRPPRDPSRNPLFQVNFRVVTEPPMLRLTGLETTHRVGDCPYSKFDLALELWNTADTFGGYWEYSTDLFDKETIVRMNEEFAALMQEVIAHPDVRLDELETVKEIRARLAPGEPPIESRNTLAAARRPIARRKAVDL